jgi:hypothetical protein
MFLPFVECERLLADFPPASAGLATSLIARGILVFSDTSRLYFDIMTTFLRYIFDRTGKLAGCQVRYIENLAAAARGVEIVRSGILAQVLHPSRRQIQKDPVAAEAVLFESASEDPVEVLDAGSLSAS